MPDTDLGDAHGEIIITADTSGVDQAAASMAALSAEGKTLEETMGRSEERLGSHEQATQRSGKSLDDLRSKHEGLRQRVREQESAAKALKLAEDDLNKSLLDVSSTSDDLASAHNGVEEARRTYAQSTKDAAAAEKAFRQEVSETSRVTQFLANRKFKIDFDGDAAIRNLQGVTQGAHDASHALASLEKAVKIESLNQSLMHLVDSINAVRSAAMMTLAGGGLAGGLGLFGAGGTEGITAIVGSMSELVGLMGLLPGVLAGAGAAAGTLVVGLHGIPEALSSMGNVYAFTKALRQLSPVAREAVIELQHFYRSFRGAMNVVQDSMINPILNDIKPLVDTYLPLLMHAGQQIGNIFGQAGHALAGWMLSPATVSTMQQFFTNVSSGMQAALPAITAFSNAFLTISTVGSGFFQQIGTAFAQVGQEFNQFISSAAQSGLLQNFIQTGINAFGVLITNVKDFTEGLMNMFAIGNQYGGGFIHIFAGLGQEFLNWTNSVKGQNAIASFFQVITEAAQNLRPIMHDVFSILGTVFSSLANLGNATAPGLTTFFHDLASALQTLSPYLIAAAPAFNMFLTAMGQLIMNVVGSMGPQLPTFLENFATAAVRLVPALTTLANVFATVMSHLTPKDMEIIFGLVTAFQALGTVIPLVTAAIAILTSPITAAVVAIGALAAGVIYAYTHWQTFHDVVNNVWQELQKLPSQIEDIAVGVGHWFTQMWDDAYIWGHNLIQNFINGMESLFDSVGNTASNIANNVFKFLGINSPSEEGPLSTDSSVWGNNLVSGFASGMSNAAPMVTSASNDIGGAAASGLVGASSTGGLGAFGFGATAPGQSGFSAYMKHLTSDLSAWSKIFKDVNNLFTKTFQTVINSIDIIARLQGGSMIAPGGIDQGAKPFFPKAIGPQQTIPGVPKTSIWTGTTHPGAGGAPPAIGTPSTAAPPSAGAPQPGDSPLVSALKQNGSFSPAQIRMIQGFSQVEGNNAAGNPTLGFTDSQLGGASDLQSHVNALAQQFKDRASVAGAFPETGTDQQQAQWIANVVGQAGLSSDWQGNRQPQDYVQRVIRAMAGIPRGGTDVGAVSGGIGLPVAPNGFPQGAGTTYSRDMMQQLGIPPLFQNPTSGNPTIPDWVQQFVKQYGGSSLTAGSTPHGSLHGIPGGPGWAVDVTGSNEDMDRLAQFLSDHPEASAMMIHQSPINNRDYGVAGGQNVPYGTYFTTPGGTYADERTMVHWAPAGGGIAPQQLPAAQALPGAGPAGNNIPGSPATGGVGAGLASLGGIGLSTYLGQRLARSGFSKWRASRGGQAFAMDAVEPTVITSGQVVDLGIIPRNVGRYDAYRGPMRTVYHATTAEGAEGILGEGFKQTGALPDAYFGADLRSALTFSKNYGLPEILKGQVPLNALRADDMTAGVRAPYDKISGIPFERVSPTDIAAAAAAQVDAMHGWDARRQLLKAQPGEATTGNARIAQRVADGDRPSIGADKPVNVNIAQDGGVRLPAGGLSTIFARSLDAIAIPGLIASTADVIKSAPKSAQGPMTAATVGTLGASTLAASSAAGIPLTGILAATAGIGVIGTAFGSASGKEPKVDYTKSGQVALGLDGKPLVWPSGKPIVVGGAPKPQPASQPNAGAPTANLVGTPVQGMARATPTIQENPVAEPTATPPAQPASVNNVPGMSVPGMIRATPTIQQNPYAEPTLPSASANFAGPGSGIGIDGQGGAQPGQASQGQGSVPQGQSSTGMSTLSMASQIGAGVGNIVGSVLQSVDSVIQSISAAANLAQTLIQMQNTQDVVTAIKDIQQFIQTGAQIAQTVSQVSGTIGGMISAFGSAGGPYSAPAGDVASAFEAVSAISSVVTSALSIVNAAITLGIDVYEEASKYAATVAGFTLGGAATGWLAGNVQLLLNTNTGQLYTSSQTNPYNKNVLLPGFQQAYQTTDANQNIIYNSVNIIGAPGQSMKDVLSDSMFMVHSGANVVSAAAKR